MLGAKIRELREAKGLTQGQLAAKVARYIPLDRAYLSQLETGNIKDPSAKLLIAIARGLNVDPDVLFQAAGYIPPSGEKVQQEERRTPYEISRELQIALTEAPILVPEMTQRAAAGFGSETEPELWPYYPRSNERGHRFIAVRISGNCMEPDIPEGYVVLADEDGSPQSGDIVVAEHDGETIVKELQKRNGDLYLVARQNREPIKVNKSTRVIGVVVQWGMKPKRKLAT
jgi:transcriptional regulator with XRE-family HTH domain